MGQVLPAASASVVSLAGAGSSCGFSPLWDQKDMPLFTPKAEEWLVFLWSLVSGGLHTRVCFLMAPPPPLYVLPSLESLHATTRWALSSAGAMPDNHLTPTPLVSTPLLCSHGTIHISH